MALFSADIGSVFVRVAKRFSTDALPSRSPLLLQFSRSRRLPLAAGVRIYRVTSKATSSRYSLPGSKSSRAFSHRFVTNASTTVEGSEVLTKIPPDDRIPATIITGFLGSGKTTLLNHILTADHGKRIAVIENEFGEIDIDGSLVAAKTTGAEDIVMLNNGCLCCTVRGDLVRMISELIEKKKGKFDHIVIETTGLANPSPIIQTFYAEDKIFNDVKLDGVVTLVDSKHVGIHLDEKKTDGVVNEAVEQIAYADRIIVNKTDLVSEPEISSLIKRIRNINTMAHLKRTSYGKVDLDFVLGIGGFDLERIESTVCLESSTEDHRELDHEHEQHDHDHHAEHHHHNHDPKHVAMTTETSSKLLDGKLVAKKIRDEIAGEIGSIKESTGIVPGLAVILVGSRKDSQTYVRNKKKACEDVGIASYEVNLPEDCSEEEVIKHISKFNSNPSVHGILVQLPLPRHMNEEKILNAVSIEKDVDGFHPLNIGRLAMQGRDPLFVPCTPKGCMELLQRYEIGIKGKRAVVIGRSNIVGMPAALLLQRANATVTMVHSYTKNPEEVTKQADIVISAAGVANLVRGSWLKPGAVVIDVGINPVDMFQDAESARGYRLVGDVCFEEACKVASAITPVPGGVGPMTIAMLLSNTLSSAKRLHEL